MPTRAFGCPCGYVSWALEMDFGEYREMGAVSQVTYQKAFSRVFKKDSVLLCSISSGRLTHVLCIIFLPQNVPCHMKSMAISPFYK